MVGQVQVLKDMGLDLKEVIKRLDPGKDQWVKLMTMGNVSFSNMLKSAF